MAKRRVYITRRCLRDSVIDLRAHWRERGAEVVVVDSIPLPCEAEYFLTPSETAAIDRAAKMPLGPAGKPLPKLKG